MSESDGLQARIDAVAAEQRYGPNRKTTPAQRREIRRRYAEGGETIRSLADEYGVYPNAIRHILKLD